MMKLFFCGDIMPGGVLPYQDKYIAPELMEYMKGFDFRIGTLEAAIGTGLSYDPVKMNGRQNIVYARNEDFFRVKEMGFDVVSLANNHIWDLGEAGLKNTIKLLQEHDIQYLGADVNIKAASKPVVLEKDGVKVALLAYCAGPDYLGYVETAGENKGGVNPFDIERVQNDIRECRKECDKVIVLPHWGKEYQCEPLPQCVSLAKQMICAGADAVLGSHSHVVQPCIKYKQGFICFSMGNFLFPDFYMYPPRPIWYPDSSVDLSSIEDIYNYPYPIEKPQRRVWSPMSRYGCVIDLSIDKTKTDVERLFVYSSNDNVETISNPEKSIMKRINRSTKMLTSAPYRLMVKSEQKVRSILRKGLSKIKG